MNSLINTLKQRARMLHKLASQCHPEAVAELTPLKRFALCSPVEISRAVTRRDCLSAIAISLGFQNWPQASAILDGERLGNFGDMLVPKGSSAFTNVWFSDYDEAATAHQQHGGFLLAYRKQYFLTDTNFIEHLGLATDDPDWTAIHRDWPNAADSAARSRLYAKLVDQRLPRLLSMRGAES